ncbi:MAG: ATP-dependent zinc metalloprotease FtsH [Anaerolineae bacterium]|nr:ATP-dependent zinc metalloprotease FtsH [Anaerolineae bacterium]
MDENRRRQFQVSIVYLVLALVGMWLFQTLIFRPLIVRWSEVPYSQFLAELEQGNVEEVTLTEDRILYTCCEAPEGDPPNMTYNVVRTEDPDLIDRLVAAGVTFRAQPPANNVLVSILGWIIPLLPFALIYFFVFRRMQQGGGAGVMSIGKSRAREITGEMTGVKFVDVGGVDEVEVELKEIIEFLKDPTRFTRLGAKLPKGILLVGPPGTGKTLLARATAGEAGVPFFSISGSDFVEMFVGVGAARVRDLFVQAKAKAPCLVFIDEIDAIGQSRSTVGAIVSNDEREQTLNQLLSEMDGFEANAGVVIMGATNRPEVLDQALLRPGRFDRQVQVTLPTETGRREILGIHTRAMPLGPDVDLGRLARITPGFSGADLANIANEAALLAVRRDSDVIAMQDFDLAIERVVAGLQRKMPLSEQVKRRVAYHEGGHALVAQLLPNTDPVHKVSIIPTAKGALGYTMQMPEEDQYLLTEGELRERMAVMLGGRSAELLIFAEATTGAANDLERATEVARRMVTEFGMTQALGPVRYADNAGSGYLSQRLGLRQELSPETSRIIDQEVRRLVDEAQDTATELLTAHIEALHQIATILIDKEVINGDEIARIAGNRRSVEG